MKKEILEKTAREYYESAQEVVEKRRYNSAVVLFFKSLVALVDLYIFQQTGKTPSSHTERFTVVRSKFSDVYEVLDRDFPFYQDSYIQLMSKELAEVLKSDVQVMAEKTSVAL